MYLTFILYNSEFLLYQMPVLFHPEDSLHFWLLWPMVRRRYGGRAVDFVKKPPLIVNVKYLELNGFNASMWVSWSLSDPKKSQCIDRCIQIHQICVNKHGYDIHIKFEVSLHFWPIWPTVRHASFLPRWPVKCS